VLFSKVRGTTPLKSELISPSQLSSSDIEAWTRFVGADLALDSPFLTPGWSQAVERAQRGLPGVARRGGPRVAIFEGEDGARGFLPVRLRGATAMPIGAPMCDYQGLIATGPLLSDARQLLGALKVDRLDFSHILADQPAFARYLRGRDVSHGIHAPKGYAAYAADHAARSGILKDLNKRRRKAEREIGPVRFEAHSRSTTAFEALVGWKRALMRATGQTDIFEAGWPLRLMHELFTGRDPDFGAVLFTLTFGDQLVASHLHLRSRHTIHAWMIGHDHAFDRYSPGLVLFQDILRWMDDTPFSYLDFGGGDYRFKQQFANTRRETGHGFVGRLSAATLVRSAEYALRAAAESLDLGHLSSLPGKAMRRLDLLRGLG